MKTNLWTCTNEFLEAFKRDFDEKYIDLYRNFDRDGIKKLFENDQVYEINSEFEYQLLKPGDEVHNTIAVYSALDWLTPVQATQEEMWFTMLNTVYLDYLLASLKQVANHQKFDQHIKNYIFFYGSTIRAQLTQRLSKYWWVGKRLYDAQNPDPYWLIRFFCGLDMSGKAIIFFASKLTNNQDIALGIVEGIYERQDKVKNVKETYSYINKHFNMIGGVKVLDIMSRDEIKRETMNFIDYFTANPHTLPTRTRQILI